MKKKNNKNRGRKSLKAAGAIIAAGLTPGIIGAAPVEPQQPSPDVELTAADVVLIDGEEINLDNMFAQVNNDEESLRRMREDMRRDSLRRIEAQHKKVYGPPSMMGNGPKRPPKTDRSNLPPGLADLKDLIYQGQPNEAYKIVKDELIEYCAFLVDAEKKGIVITEESKINDDLKMTTPQLVNLAYQVKRRYNVSLTHDEILETSNLGNLTGRILQGIIDSSL